MAPANPNGQRLFHPKSRIDRGNRHFNTTKIVAEMSNSTRLGHLKRPDNQSQPDDGIYKIENLVAKL